MSFQLLFRAATLLLASALSCAAQTYSWSAFAGLPPQFGSTDGVGTSARFFGPSGMVGTTAGFIFVCDGNNTIRRIGPDGAVVTFAGTPGGGGAVDGTGPAARFAAPSGIVLVNGFLYVADQSNHAIRRVSGAGVVTTFAGRLGISGAADGNGGSARFNQPSAIATDGANLFVADTNNHVIRKITPDGEVTTLAGRAGQSGAADGGAADARFNRPGGLYATTVGLFVADTYNHTIRRISPEGAVSTLAGQAGTSGAVNGLGSAARFRFPRGIIAFNSGIVLVVDQTHVVRQISPEGLVATSAGRLDVQGSRNGSRTDARFHLPIGLAFISDGVAVADHNNHAIRRILSTTGEVSTIAGSTGNFGREDGVGPEARFSRPHGVAVHSSGDVYLADAWSNSIRRISPQGQVVRVAGAAEGDAYTDGPAGANSLNYPMGVAVAPDRTVYFCEYQRHTIRVLRPDGSVATLAGREGVPGSTDGTGDNARFAFPTGIALDASGNLYVADSNNHVIRQIAAGTANVTTFAGTRGVSGAVDGASASARFNLPRGLAADADGNIYVADTSNHLIRKISGGEVSTVAGAALVSGSANGAGGTARFFLPWTVAVDAQGTLFVADEGNDLIRRISGGTVSTIGGIAEVSGYVSGVGTSTLFFKPTGIAAAADGTLYVSEDGNNIVRRGEPIRSPAISAQPRSLSVPVGANATLSVTATGGALFYQWRFNGVPISGATAATYTITNLTPALAGAYSVTITNPAGSITSDAAAITIGSASDAGRIINLSILTSIASPGDNFTMGFVLGGAGATGSKPLVIRAAGPSLGALGVGGTLDDPKLDLFFGGNATGGNDNWGGAATLATAMNNVGAFAYLAPTSRDAATASDFQLGNNSVRVAAADTGTGMVIAEIYDATPSSAFTAATPRLVNVSVLKHIGTGLIAGFAIGGNTAKSVLIRAIGPTLAAAPFGVGDTVADPQLTLFSGSTQIGFNDNWGGTAALTVAFNQVGAFELPAASRDAALIATLNPGTYTVQVSGVGGGTGNALIEIYEVP